jgi:transporter family-2 protein
MLRDAGTMLMAGIGVPILAAISAQLGSRIGAPLAAGVVAVMVALIVALIAAVVTGQAGALTKVAAQPAWLWMGGAFMAFYLLSITWIAPRFGVGNAVFCVLLGQMIAASAIDQFGLFGAVQNSISLTRALGIGTMLLGLVLIRLG